MQCRKFNDKLPSGEAFSRTFAWVATHDLTEKNPVKLHEKWSHRRPPLIFQGFEIIVYFVAKIQNTILKITQNVAFEISTLAFSINFCPFRNNILHDFQLQIFSSLSACKFLMRSLFECGLQSIADYKRKSAV